MRSPVCESLGIEYPIIAFSHCRDVVADAVAPLPVLAAGGIGCGRQMAAALALGAKGV